MKETEILSKVTLMGLGYIGLPTAALLTKNNIQVHGVDINPVVVETINAGKIHFIEPDLLDNVKTAVETGLLEASSEPVASDVFIIVVPTPFKGNHEPDISYVISATKKIIPFLKENDLYIIESTSPIGTTEKMRDLIYLERPELRDKLFIAYCPERVLPGNIMYELEHNDRVIGGIDARSTEKATAFYKRFVHSTIYGTNSKTAEMCKLTENASRDVQIAFANELSIICDKAGINVWELIELANKHPRVKILQPGSGVGGHCIAVDPWFIVSDYPLETKIIGSAREVNNYKAFWCSEKINNAKIQFELTVGRKPVIACMGLAFKPDIDDLRESPAKYITQKIMQSENNSTILIVEPNIGNHPVFKLTDYAEAYEKADIVAFLVAHKQFKTLAYREDKIILDFCGIFKNRN
jgi:UDP-N-acetyl-D-mannosaminuronic acid dehydrogenase